MAWGNVGKTLIRWGINVPFKRFPSKIGVFARGEKERKGKKKKNGGRIAGATTLQRFSTAILCFVCTRLYAACPVARNTKKSRHLAPVRNNSRQRPIFYFPLPPWKNNETTRKYFPKKRCHSSYQRFIFFRAEKKNVDPSRGGDADVRREFILALTITLKMRRPSCFGARHEHSFTAGRRILRWIRDSSHFPPIHSRRTFLRLPPSLRHTHTYTHTRTTFLSHKKDFFPFDDRSNDDETPTAKHLRATIYTHEFYVHVFTYTLDNNIAAIFRGNGYGVNEYKYKHTCRHPFDLLLGREPPRLNRFNVSPS